MFAGFLVTEKLYFIGLILLEETILFQISIQEYVVLTLKMMRSSEIQINSNLKHILQFLH